MARYSGGGATKKPARLVTTRRADGFCGRSLRWSSSKMAKHRLPPPALISPRKPHLQTLPYLRSSVLRRRLRRPLQVKHRIVLLVLFLLLPFGCRNGLKEAGTLLSDLNSSQRSFLIELGLDDPKASDWSGQLETPQGTVQLASWHFSPEDSLGPGLSWAARTRKYDPRATVYWEEPTENQMFVRKDVLRSTSAYSQLMWPGLLVVTEGPQELTLKTPKGSLTIDTQQLEPGLRRSYLEGRVVASQVPLSQVLTGEETYDDFPALLVQDGKCRISWIEYRDGEQRILSRRLEGQAWSSLLEIQRGQDLSGLQVVRGEEGSILWIWSQQIDGNWDLYGRSQQEGVLQPLKRLTESPLPDLYPRVAPGPNGEAHLVWQGFRGGQSDIFIKSLKGGVWSGERKVSSSSANDWKPTLTVDSKGRVYVVWDSYDRGDYDLLLRRLERGVMGEIVPVARSRNFEAYADLACDDQDRIWVAWNETGPNWGKDSGFWVDRTRKTFEDERSIRVAVYDGDQWSRPVGDLSDGLESHFSRLSRSGLRLYRPPDTEQIRFRNDNDLPRLVWDTQGRMWLFFRHQQSTAGDGSFYRPAWEVYATFYQGSSWATPFVLPQSAGRLNMPLALDGSAEGTLWMAWLTDHRSLYPGTLESGALQEDVVVGRLDLSGQVTAAQLQEYQGIDEPIKSYHTDEPGDLSRIRSYRIDAEGKTYRIVRGDLHRHTDYSGDGALDSSLHETYRYALDAASLDFLAITDHYPGKYVWWETQKSVERFHIPGTFVPLLGYERNLGFPNGHRNVVFARRGAPILEAGPEERSGIVDTGAVLYDYLRKYRGLSMPHSSGTPTMGTDWRDHAGDVEPLVEIFQGDRTSYEYPGAPLAAVREDASTHRGGYLEEGFVWKAWEKGYRLGVQASSDHWSTHYSYACLLVERFDPEGLMDAMRRRHAYAATDNIILDFRAEEGDRIFIMGDAFDAASSPTLRLHAEGTNPIAEVVLIRDNRVIYSQTPKQRLVDFSFVETDPSPGTHFYYARVQQADEQVAWSSPIWISFR